MADVRPIQALHYDLGKVGSLDAVAAPPYDVIDAAGRARAARALALQRGRDRSAEAVRLRGPGGRPDGDPYAEAARTIDAWRDDGALVADDEPSIWALTQDYTAPDGSSHSRHGILARVRVEDYETGAVRPHERTHPGPLLDRLELTRATRYNLSPIFSLSTEDAWPLVEPALAAEPWGKATDEDGTVNRVWKVTDPASSRPSRERLAGAELLIADGHHRYETARAYRDEVGGEGPHELHADVADRPRRPRPHRLPHPPPTLRLRRRSRAEARASAAGCASCSTPRRSRPRAIDPGGEDGVGVFGLYDGFHKQAYRLRLKDSADSRPPARRQTRVLPPPRLGDPRDPGPQGPGRDERPRHRRARAGSSTRRAFPTRWPWSTSGESTSPSSSARSRSSRSRRSPRPTRTCRRSRPTSSPR